MDVLTSIKQVKRFAARFAGAHRGGVAMIFALSLPPMILMTVGAVDIHRASTVRVNLQDALDAAALAAARSPYTDDHNVNRIGQSVLEANLQAYPEITLTDSSFDLNDEGVVIASAQVDVKTLVANIVLPPYGQFMDDQLPVGAESEVMRSNNRIEVALVLDNTGSMAGAKLANTKAAALELINRLERADERSVEVDAISISLVPFSQTVRVSNGYSAATGVAQAAASGWLSNSTSHTGGTGATGLFTTGVGRFTLFATLGTGWGGCIEARPQPYDIRDTGPSAGDQARMFVPYFAPDEPDEGDYPNDNTWQNYNYENNNYLNDGINGSKSSSPFANNDARRTAWFNRVKNNAKYVFKSGLNTGFGPNKGCNLQPIIRLTDDYDALRTAVSNMTATGNTNVPLGAMWGWHTLSPNGPFGDGRPYGEERLKKIIIIMTDGENVMSDNNSPNDSSYNGLGYIWQGRLGITSGANSTRRSRMDDRLDHPTAGVEDLCGNMKAQDIDIYTVAVQVDGTAQAMLQRCATDANHYFNVTNANDIGSAFDRIAGQIENLRISR